MAINSVQFETVGQSGMLPRFCYISTSNTLAQVVSPGFLNKLVTQGQPLSESLIAVVEAKNLQNKKVVNFYSITYSAGNWSLVLKV